MRVEEREELGHVRAPRHDGGVSRGRDGAIAERASRGRPRRVVVRVRAFFFFFRVFGGGGRRRGFGRRRRARTEVEEEGGPSDSACWAQ
jgi:hypothetical protein